MLHASAFAQEFNAQQVSSSLVFRWALSLLCCTLQHQCKLQMQHEAYALLTLMPVNICNTCASLQVAVERSKGNLSGAIELLRKYVDIYMLDKVAWEELGELYLEVSTLSATCMCKYTALHTTRMLA